ncbi:hypothetical protein JVU11DRAFT_5939 [Chiua virens]|nr:hypothetical protein JVU11DRAFT_5939 [Chiua virens]
MQSLTPLIYIVRPTAFTAEYLAHFLRDTHRSVATEIATGGTQLPSRAVSSTPLPHERESVVDARSKISDPATSSLDAGASVVPSPGVTSSPSSLMRAQVQPSPLQAHSRGAKGVDSSMTSPQMSSFEDSQTLPTSVLCASSATIMTPTSDAGASDRPPGSNPEDAHAGRDDSPATNTVEICIELAPVVQTHCQHSSRPVSCLPTPPSEASIDDYELRVVSVLTHDHAAAANTTADPRPCPLLKLPVIPTPPSLTPEPSGGGERLVISSTGFTGFYSGLPSPSTPMLPPSTMDEVLPLEEGVKDVSREVGDRKDTGERGHLSDDVEGNATEVFCGDTSMNDAPTSTANTGTPVISVTNEPLSKVDSSQIPGNVEPCTTPRSSPEQRHIELPNDAPGPDNSCPQVGGHIRFSSLANLTSAPPSRYTTPSESLYEDEVWHTLMPDASGLSTPAPDDTSLPLMASHQPSRVSSVRPDTSHQLSGSTLVNDVDHDHSSASLAPASLGVDPSLLHDPPLQCHEPEPPTSPLTPESSLSSLTSVAGSDDARRDGEASPASSPIVRLRQRGMSEMTLACTAEDPFEASEDSSELEAQTNVDDEHEGAARAEVAAVALAAVSRMLTPDVTSTSSVSCKRTKRYGELKGNATPQKKVHREHGMKPRSLVTHHVHDGRIVTVSLFSPLESQAQASVTPCIPQSSVHTEEAGQGSQAPTRRRKRNGRGNKTKAVMSPSTTSNRRMRLSSKKDDVWDSIYEHSGTWPEFPGQFEQWDLQFIQCDNCDEWYHYGCVGIVAGDPRLGLGAYFGCPECYTPSARWKTARRRKNVCKRPDCPEPHITGDTEVYYVEKLVGRKKVDEDTYMWLAKWDGYPMSEATWIPKENVVGGGTRMFDVFAEDAVEEGVYLSQDVLLLQEALDAGFGVEDG